MAHLVGDIGGTHSRFALVELTAGKPLLHAARQTENAGFASLTEAARHYVDSVGAQIDSVVLAVAAPVSGPDVQLINLNWSFNQHALCKQLGASSLKVINDFTAVSYCLPLLGVDDVRVIGDAPFPADPATLKRLAVLGPGTGMGVGGVVRAGDMWAPLVSEGGHATIAPHDADDIAVVSHVMAKHGRVFNEMLLSGPGLCNLYDAIAAIRKQPTEPLSPAEITTRALAGGDPLCKEVLDRFCAMLGSVAGDIAMLWWADVVFIAGGIVPRFVDYFATSGFRARFEAKSDYSRFMRPIPTCVITEPNYGLLGAAACL
ncbi:MAG: glucokinase [Gammaproteobacteria bacterium]|nr:glucokinase [Gammaproteobacteria bacterium]